MKTVVMYHADCSDGFGAAYCAWVALGDEDVKFIGLRYGDIKEAEDFDIVLDKDTREVYVLDFSFPPELMAHLRNRVQVVKWIDHHKTAFEDLGLDPEARYEVSAGHYTLLDNSRSGAWLAAEHFLGAVPRLLKHVDDRDRWQFNMPGTQAIHAALQLERPWTFEKWHNLVEDDRCTKLRRTGESVLKVYEHQVRDTVATAKWCDLDGLRGMAVNAREHISEVGNRLAFTSETFGLVWYYDAATGMCNCSLRSVGDYDVSEIAKRYGGGGHKNAAGFRAHMHQLMGWL